MTATCSGKSQNGKWRERKSGAMVRAAQTRRLHVQNAEAARARDSAFGGERLLSPSSIGTALRRDEVLRRAGGEDARGPLAPAAQHLVRLPAGDVSGGVDLHEVRIPLTAVGGEIRRRIG